MGVRVRVRVRVEVRVRVRGESAFDFSKSPECRAVVGEVLFSTNRNLQAPRGLVGSSTISDEGLAVRILVTPISLFQLWFFFCSKSVV